MNPRGESGPDGVQFRVRKRVWAIDPLARVLLVMVPVVLGGIAVLGMNDPLLLRSLGLLVPMLGIPWVWLGVQVLKHGSGMDWEIVVGTRALGVDGQRLAWDSLRVVIRDDHVMIQHPERSLVLHVSRDSELVGLLEQAVAAHADAEPVAPGAAAALARLRGAKTKRARPREANEPSSEDGTR